MQQVLLKKRKIDTSSKLLINVALLSFVCLFVLVLFFLTEKHNVQIRVKTVCLERRGSWWGEHQRSELTAF